MRLALVLGAAAVLTGGCAGPTSTGGGSARPVSTALEISVLLHGTGGGKRFHTLRCPSGGSLPHAQEACRKLARLRSPFAPVPKDVSCTEIYGGPQTASVRGIFRGRRITASFNRQNGCEIARWNRVSFLFRAR